jgi:Zn-dependent M28 family amino/carboxypeptidase
MRITNRLIAFFVVTAFAIAAVAQQPAQNGPSAERLREHITYLASDKLEGRRTGTAGANLAAEYIAREFSRYGLRRSIGRDLPGMSILEADSPKRYLQEFPYVAGVELEKNNRLLVNSPRAGDQAALAVGEDWMPLGSSSRTEIQKVPYVFVGYGITAAELKYENYGPEVKDRIAIALSGTPDGDNPHGQFARYEDVHWKAIAARNAGAKALIVIAQETNFKEDRLSRLRYDNSAGDIGLPVAVISRQAAAKLFTTSGDLSNLIEAAKPEANESLPPGARIDRLLPLQKGTSLSLSIAVSRQEVAATNVIGILDGSDPRLKNEVVIVGAHYDHLGHGGSGSLAAREGEIHHGADDNASGTAGVLELARLFAAQRPRPRRTIVFIAFSGEEEGLLGSNYYVNHPIVPLANTVAMINMDMIGRLKDRSLIVGGVGTAEGWRSMVEARNELDSMTVTASTGTGPSTVSVGFPTVVASNGRPIVTTDSAKQFALTLNEDGFGPSDHSSFYMKQIPVLFFWTGTHADYHKPTDTSDKINYDGEVSILNMVSRLVHDIDAGDKRPTYTVAKTEAPAGRSTGFRVYLGTIPNYADSNDGLLLDGVRDDSPAAKAGLKAGDKVVKLAGRDLRNVYDYTYALGEMKAGQEYEIEVMRGGERLKMKITPAAKK